jgi:transposase
VSAGWEAASREDLLALIGLLQRQEQVHKEQIAELWAANVALTEANAALTEANAVLVRRVAELEKKVNRNSGNSNMPPSTDVFGLPKDDQATTDETGGDGRGAAGKARRGKRNGAQGTSLALTEDPEVVKDVFPPACGGCAAVLTGLSAADSLGYVRRQCTDIPPVSAQVTETRWHTVGCGCGARTAAQVPAGVPDAPCYGPGLAALAVYLLVYQHVPVERTAELIRDLTGARVSTGWVAAQLPKTAGIVAGSLRLIKALLTLGHVLHADETTTNIAGARRYLHAACTESLTFLGLAPRSRAGANGLGILPQFRGTMVHDAYFQLYDGYPEARHQLCVAHVIRELTAQDELRPDQRWARQIRWVFSQLIKQAAAARAEGLRHIPPERIAPLIRSYHRGVADGLALHPRTSETGKQSDATNLLERLRDHADQYLRFTHDLHVPATNNLAERDQRPVKTQVKISGCHQSETGARNWLDVRSYLSSARKHGIGAFDALHQAMTGTPWIPPIILTD